MKIIFGPEVRGDEHRAFNPEKVSATLTRLANRIEIGKNFLWKFLIEGQATVCRRVSKTRDDGVQLLSPSQ